MDDKGWIGVMIAFGILTGVFGYIFGNADMERDLRQVQAQVEQKDVIIKDLKTDRDKAALTLVECQAQANEACRTEKEALKACRRSQGEEAW